MQDLTGQKFGRLTVIELDHKTRYYWKGVSQGFHYFWKCKCDCGNIIIVDGGHLKTGHSRSCGCYKNELLVNRVKKHGLSNARINRIFGKMMQRCYNVNNPKYKNYGYRGIKICDEWLNDKTKFFEWAFDNGYNNNLSIDRIDVNGNYEPSNCRWATIEQQSNNKTNSHYITYNNKKLTISQWGKELNIPTWKIHKNIKKYNDDVEALKQCLN